MDALEKIRVVTGNDLEEIAMTVMDMLVVVDRDQAVTGGTCPMPTAPYPKQFFILTTRVTMTSLTMNSGGKTIHGNITSLDAFSAVAWCYEEVSDSWFPLFKSPAAPIIGRVTGSNATTTGQVLVDVTGLVVPLAANSLYEFEAILSASTSAVTTGTAYGVNFSAAGAQIEAIITGSSTSTATKTLRINAFNTPTTLYLATSNQTGGILIKGTVVTGANAGNLSIQHAKLTSGTATVFIGSPLKATRVS